MQVVLHECKDWPNRKKCLRCYLKLPAPPFFRHDDTIAGSVIIHLAAIHKLQQTFVGLPHSIPMVSQLLLAPDVLGDGVEQAGHVFPIMFDETLAIPVSLRYGRFISSHESSIQV